MSARPTVERALAAAGADDQVAESVRALAALLRDLEAGHQRLEARAERVEAELAVTNAELEAVLRALPTGVLVYDSEDRVVRANDAACAILGADEDRLVGACEPDVLRGVGEDPTEVRLADGRARVLARRRSAFVDADGRARGAVEVIDDRTALERTKERLHRIDRVAALGTMAGGIAHEIRNPLHAVGGFAQLLLRAVGGDEKASHHARRILDGVRDIDAIVSSMLGLAGNGKPHLERLDPREVAERAADAALRSRERPERWRVRVDGDAVEIHADRIKLRQALRNLVANACDAQPDGGEVRIALAAHSSELCALVHDSGPGVPSEVRDRVFDPFFSTRADGTGVGLAVVQRIAQVHGGTLELSPEPGPLGGAAFALRIPTDPPSQVSPETEDE